MIIDTDMQEIAYAISTGGAPFPGLKSVLDDIQYMGGDLYVASGDSMRSLMYLSDLGISKEKIYPVSDPRRKLEIVLGLKNKYKKVIMVGDGLNDIYALKAADLGVLSVQQDSRPSSSLLCAADEILLDILDLPAILKRASNNPI